MRLPQDILAQARQAVQALWDDHADVTRKAEQDQVMEDVPVYTGILCHLSCSNRASLDQTNAAAQTQMDYTLFADVSIEIKEGDTVTVRHKGQTIQGVAGKPFYRDFSNAAKLSEVTIA